MPDRLPSEWYSEGLRFECTCCGACCTGPPGLVEFTREEGIQMAEALGLSYPQFLRRHASRTDRGWALLEIEAPTGEGLDCAMLDRHSDPPRVLCQVHQHRPTQCRTWPFWPATLRSPRAWRDAGRRCQGIDRGPLFDLEAIRRQRDETPAD